MTEIIEVSIEYYGQFSKITTKKEEKIRISPFFNKGVKDIRNYLNENYSINQGFMMLINNDHEIKLLKKHEKTMLSENDVFRIIPIVSGG